MAGFCTLYAAMPYYIRQNQYIRQNLLTAATAGETTETKNLHRGGAQVQFSGEETMSPAILQRRSLGEETVVTSNLREEGAKRQSPREETT